MRAAYPVEAVRRAELATGAALTDGILMQRAAGALAAYGAASLYRVYGAHVVVLVGSGDNGGDALFAGAALARRGARVDAVLLAGSAYEAALAALRSAGGRCVDAADPAAAEHVRAAELVLDGITGIGGRGGLRPAAAALVAEIPDAAVIVAVDVPSGVDADTGEVDGAVVDAHLTVTFGVAKPGLLVAPGATHAGRVVVVDIGIESYLDVPPAVESLEPDDVAALLRRPRPTDDKYSRGVVGIAAGSERYTGAGALAVAGSAGAGAGMVRFASTPAAVTVVRELHPEAIVADVGDDGSLDAVGRVQSWVVGPGGGTDDRAAAVLRSALATDLPLVVDADGLTLLAERPELVDLVRSRNAPTVLTPHAGELARLLAVGRDDVERSALHHVRVASERFSAVVLLKGTTTLVAGPDVPVRANPPAVAWLATAGAGDVLAGVIGALLAAGLGGVDAASAAAWLHAGAAEAASQGGPLAAGEIAIALPAVVAALLEPFGAEDSGT